MAELWQGIFEGLIAYVERFSTEQYIFGLITFIKIIVIIIVARIIIHIMSSLTVRFFDRQTRSRYGMNEKKANTLKMLTQSILRYVVYFIVAMNIIVLLGLGVTAQSIVATAGIGGLAIGFGAQNLVRDMITGFFILFEDQYAVGDFVNIGDITGTVEDIELRITKIRGFKGDLTIIPNGQVLKVTNFSRGNSLAIVEMSIAYEVNIERAMQVMEETGLLLADGHPDIVEPPQVLGVVGFGDSEVNLRMIARTLPMKHWGVERELRKKVKEAFDAQGIEIPYPRRVVLTPKEKEAEDDA